jgi:hypothetical protein
VKDPEAEQERGWPYPLRIYYQGSNARCGLDIVVRDRVIKSGVFEEIWPEIGKTVDFNKFVGEVKVGEGFRTTNNKIAQGRDPNDFTDLDQIVDRLAGFEDRYNNLAEPFDWRFTRADLNDLLERITQHDPIAPTPLEAAG